jgi:hypothetical protein
MREPTSLITTKRLTQEIASLNTAIEEWLISLDQDEPTDDLELTLKLEALQQNKADKETQLQALTAAEKTNKYSVDKDARLLNKRGPKN